MPANRTQSVRVGCALSLLAGLMVGIILFIYYQDITSCHSDMSPLISMGVTVDPSQDQQFIEQSRQFAFKYNFRLDIGDPDQQDGDFRIRMLRKDIEVIARSPSTPGGYEVEFYNYDCIHPLVASDLTDLVNDFKSFMSEIPGVTITEIK
ncbi:MAG TPA: hypothetical protein VLS45_02185 [Methylomicrobium sp.]|nr:hypothetical protein [Methylomicrobium sp.]